MILCELLHWAIFRLTALADDCLRANQNSTLTRNLNESKQLAFDSKMRCARRANVLLYVCLHPSATSETLMDSALCSCLAERELIAEVLARAAADSTPQGKHDSCSGKLSICISTSNVRRAS